MPLVLIVLVSTPSFAQSRNNDAAIVGGVAGAIIGGIAGHQNDETPEGIAIGGAVGAIAGGLLGRSQQQQAIWNQQQRHYAQQQQQYLYQQRQQQISRAISLNDVIQLSRSGLSAELIR